MGARLLSRSNGGKSTLVNAALALTLVAVAGCVDAIAYLQFDHLFVSFMSGNSTTFGIDVARGEWTKAVHPLTAIAGFVAGTFLGTLIAHAAGRFRVPAVLRGVAVTLVLALPAPSTGFAPAVAALALAMGMQNMALGRVGRVGRVGGIKVSLTYVTAMVARTGQGLARALINRSGRAQHPFKWVFFSGLWASLVVGVLIGATAYGKWGLDALTGPAVLLAALTAARRHPR